LLFIYAFSHYLDPSVYTYNRIVLIIFQLILFVYLLVMAILGIVTCIIIRAEKRLRVEIVVFFQTISSIMIYVLHTPSVVIFTKSINCFLQQEESYCGDGIFYASYIISLVSLTFQIIFSFLYHFFVFECEVGLIYLFIFILFICCEGVIF
jgi:hypothetical protein